MNFLIIFYFRKPNHNQRNNLSAHALFVWLSGTSPPVGTATEAFYKVGCDSPRRSHNKHRMPSDLLGPLITSKTRFKLRLRFFLNQNLSGYLQGLSKELDENTNSVRIELNRLELAGLLSAVEQGRRKVFSVNTAHPLTTDLLNMLR